MATKPKRTRKKAPQPTRAETVTDLRVKSAPNPAPASINDSRGTGAAVLGHFVSVTGGEHEGRYGVFIEVSEDGKTAVVRTRDSDSERLLVPVKDLRPAQAGLR